MIEQPYQFVQKTSTVSLNKIGFHIRICNSIPENISNVNAVFYQCENGTLRKYNTH